jgi:hypothetical protein
MRCLPDDSHGSRGGEATVRSGSLIGRCGVVAAGQALGSSTTGPGYAGALDQAQSLSLRALTQAQQAWSVMRSQLAAAEVANKGFVPYAGLPSLAIFPAQPQLDSAGNPVPMFAPAEASTQLRTAVSRYNASALDYRTANGWLAEAIAARDAAAARAAAAIQAAIGKIDSVLNYFHVDVPGYDASDKPLKELGREAALNVLGLGTPEDRLEKFARVIRDSTKHGRDRNVRMGGLIFFPDYDRLPPIANIDVFGYYSKEPGKPGAWLLLAFSGPDGPLSPVMAELFDAIAATLRWAG